METEDYQIQWVEEIENHEEGVSEEVIAVENAQETHIAEGGGYIVQEITQIPNSIDQIAAENLIYMAHDGQMTSIDDLIEENVEENALEYENDDQDRQQQYFECQVTEEVITDDWVQQQGKECVEIPVDQICGLRSSTNQLVEDIDVPLPTDQDEYTALRPYPCDFCSRRFRKKVSLMNHMVAHQNDRPNVCNLCGARYVRKTDLLNHLKTHAHIPEQIDEISEHYLGDHIESRSATERYFDDVSSLLEKPKQKTRARNKKQRTKTGLKFSTYEKIEKSVIEEQIPQEVIEKYPVIDPRRPFVCQQCGVSFAREKALLSHHRLHGGDSPYECQQCNEMFWDINMLNDHQKTHHFEASNSEYEPENDEETESEDSKYGEYYCNVCGMSFHRQDLLKRHTKTHIKREIIQSDGICGESTRHCCNVCGETFAEALDLLAHAEIHARVQPYKCTLCGETFLEEATIKKHLMNVHSDEMTENSCKICGKHCKDLKSLTKHAWDHSRDKNHSCSKCGKNFHNKARLKRHMTSHRNKSVTCEVCNEEFPDGRSLMNHRHSHSNASGRQFPCHECGKTFGSRSSQQIHVRIHTGERPYGCRFCWKAFADGGTLRKHERIHTGEKPYACSVCPRAFNQRVVLREHIRAHHSGIDANRGVYVCSVCQSTLPSSSDLIQHLIHHSDLNTAMHRQPITGPRKYKRRRKLKPHEIMKLRHEKSNNSDDIDYSDLDIAHVDDLLGISNKNKRRSDYINTSSTTITHQNTSARNRKYSSNSDKLTSNWQQKLMSPTSNDDTYNGVFQNLENTLNNIDSLVVSSTTNTTQTMPIVNSTINQTISPTTSNVNTPNKGNKTGPKRRGGNKDSTEKSSRPKMIHTQKTRVAAEEGSKRRTRTLITRTKPSDIDNNSFIQKRNTSRSKSKSNYDRNSNEYEMIIPDPEPCTTEQEQKQHPPTPTRTDLFDAQLLLETATMRKDSAKYTPDVINDLEEILRSPIKRKSKSPSTVREPSIFVIEKISSPSSQSNQRASQQQQQQQKQKHQFHEEDLRRSTRLKRTSIPNKKYLEYDMSSTSKSTGKQSSSSMKNDQEKNDDRNSSDLINKDIKIKVENITDDIESSDKISIDNSKIKTESYFQCEMCCAVFTDRAQLLVHVPIHI